MQLALAPDAHPPYPLAGVLMQGPDVAVWAREIERMAAGSSCTVYPLPGREAGTVWGCLLLCNPLPAAAVLERHSYCRLVGSVLFIPDHTTLEPLLRSEEVYALLGGEKYLLHPEVGLFHLATPLDWSTVLRIPPKWDATVIKPAAGVTIPDTVHAFRIQPLPPDEILNALEGDAFPKKEKLPDEPLNLAERLRMNIYRLMFRRGEDGMKKTGLGRGLDRFLKRFSKEGDDASAMKRMEKDSGSLEARNDAALDRLMQLFRDNPEEALKYAIPLDETGTSRGKPIGNASFDFAKRWNSFSLWGSTPRSTGGAGVMADDSYARLQQQYNQTAEDLKRFGLYEKAAFVYLRLLKNPWSAAGALEEGGLWSEAAAVYLKHATGYSNSKAKAAECYEKGNMTTEAISLYTELDQHEKVGDLYTQLAQRSNALRHYELVSATYIETARFRKAATLRREKMDDAQGAHDLLLQGWRENKDGAACLHDYFDGFPSGVARVAAIQRIYEQDTTLSNRERFLSVIKKEAGNDSSSDNAVRSIAYEIVAEGAEHNPGLVEELRAFDKENVGLLRDVMRYKVGRKKRR